MASETAFCRGAGNKNKIKWWSSVKRTAQTTRPGQSTRGPIRRRKTKEDHEIAGKTTHQHW